MLAVEKQNNTRPRVTVLPAQVESDHLRLSATDSQMAVIAGALMHPQTIPVLLEMLQPGDFYSLHAGIAFKAIVDLVTRGVALDMVMVATEMSVHAKTTVRDELEWLMSIADRATYPEAVLEHAGAVRMGALRLRLLTAASDVKSWARDTAMSAEQLMANAMTAVNAALEQYSAPASDMNSTIDEYLETFASERPTRHVGTGFNRLDDAIGGGLFSELIVIGGASGLGKTTFSMSMLRAACRRKQRAVLFSYEMTRLEILNILLSMESGVHKSSIRSNQLDETARQRVLGASTMLRDWDMRIIDDPGANTPTAVLMRLMRLQKERPVDLIMIDGLWLMDYSAEPDARTPRHEAVNIITTELVKIARRFDAPVVITQQLKSDRIATAKKKRPTIDDFAESSAVKRNAQVLLGVHRNSYYTADGLTDNSAEVLLLKDRNGVGRMQIIPLTYSPRRTLYLPQGQSDEVDF